MGRGLRWFAGAAVPTLALMLVAAPAQAAFPGTRGKIAFADTGNSPSSIGGNVFTAYEGGARTQLTSFASARNPAWSSDGNTLAFVVEPDSRRFGGEIWRMGEDGSSQTRLTSGHYDDGPAWSPDGTTIAFARHDSTTSSIYVMSADGSEQTEIHSGQDPSWSPDGTRIAFSDGDSDGSEIWTMNPDGTGASQVTVHDRPNDKHFFEPDWSPDGRYIAFENTHCPEMICLGGFDYEVHRISPDGTGRTLVTPAASVFGNPTWSPDGREILVQAYVHSGAIGGQNGDDLYEVDPAGTAIRLLMKNAKEPSWQPISGFPGFPRPRGATPFQVSLVPAFRACIDPNMQHGAPLAIESCSPPVQSSDFLTVGTPDTNGLGARSVGFFRASAIVGETSTTFDDADLAYSFRMTDVWLREAADDYVGQLRLTSPLRISDKNNDAGDGATMTSNAISLTIPCAQTADPARGSECSLTTTADTLAPGTIVEDARAVWELGDVRVFDGGTDGVANPDGNDTLFAVPGVFAP